MDKALRLCVLTHAGVALEERAVSVIARGELGFLGVLPRHASLVTTLAPGALTWQRPDGTRHITTLGSGLLEVARNEVTILTDTMASPAVVRPGAHKQLQRS